MRADPLELALLRTLSPVFVGMRKLTLSSIGAFRLLGKVKLMRRKLTAFVTSVDPLVVRVLRAFRALICAASRAVPFVNLGPL